jgi:hypothetical protein
MNETGDCLRQRWVLQISGHASGFCAALKALAGSAQRYAAARYECLILTPF